MQRRLVYTEAAKYFVLDKHLSQRGFVMKHCNEKKKELPFVFVVWVFQVSLNSEKLLLI